MHCALAVLVVQFAGMLELRCPCSTFVKLRANNEVKQTGPSLVRAHQK